MTRTDLQRYAALLGRELLASGVRHVRTPAGVKHFDQPIGSVIVPDVVPSSHGTIGVKGVAKMSATEEHIAKQVAALSRAQVITLKALTELTPKATSDPIDAGDISQHLYGKRIAASAIQTAFNDPALADFVDIKRLPNTAMRKTRILYRSKRWARQAAAAGLLNAIKKVTPTQERALLDAHESLVGMVSDTGGVKRSTLQVLAKAGLVEIQSASGRRGASPTGRVGKNYDRIDTTVTATLTDEGRRYLREVLGKKDKRTPRPESSPRA